MIKMTYKQFMGFPFAQAMQKLSNQAYPAKTAYSLKKLVDSMTIQRKAIQTEYQTLIDKYAKRDEKGEMIRPDGPQSFDLDPAQKEAYDAEEAAFGKTEFTIERPKLMLDMLGEQQFSATDLSALEPLIQDPEAHGTAETNVKSIRGGV